MPNEDDGEELQPVEEAPPEPPEQEQATNAFFVEADEVIALIGRLSEEGGKHEEAADRIAKVLDQYQEQPSILDPQLDSLGNYGGPTQTRRPQLGSFALDNALSCPVLTDQRGAGRPNGSAADIGAVEAQQELRVTVATDDSDDPYADGLSLREAIDFADPVDTRITFGPLHVGR